MSSMVLYQVLRKRDEQLHVSIVVSIPACHAGDRGSIPRRGVLFLERGFYPGPPKSNGQYKFYIIKCNRAFTFKDQPIFRSELQTPYQ